MQTFVYFNIIKITWHLFWSCRSLAWRSFNLWLYWWRTEIQEELVSCPVHTGRAWRMPNEWKYREGVGVCSPGSLISWLLAAFPPTSCCRLAGGGSFLVGLWPLDTQGGGHKHISHVPLTLSLDYLQLKADTISTHQMANTSSRKENHLMAETS